MGRYITFDEKIPKWNYLIKPGNWPSYFLIIP
jgi:hypothetical protein